MVSMFLKKISHESASHLETKMKIKLKKAQSLSVMSASGTFG